MNTVFQRNSPGSHLDDVVSAEDTTSVASVSVLSDGALHLSGTHQKHHVSITHTLTFVKTAKTSAVKQNKLHPPPPPLTGTPCRRGRGLSGWCPDWHSGMSGMGWHLQSKKSLTLLLVNY